MDSKNSDVIEIYNTRNKEDRVQGENNQIKEGEIHAKNSQIKEGSIPPYNGPDNKAILTKKIILIISITAGIVIIVALAIALPLTLKKDDDDNKITAEYYNITEYGCLIDAGSSSSKGYLFKWQNKSIDYSISEIIQIKKSNKVKPGLAACNTESIIETHMNTLLDFCKNEINTDSNNTANFTRSPFYLKATAGMRKLDENEQNNKINTVRKIIKNSNFMFAKDDWARVISGKDEGMYGWITVNYLKNILSENDKANKIKEKPFNVIDVGGSSIEITYIPDKNLNSDEIKNIPLGQLSYDVYVQVYELFGQDDAFAKLLKLLIEKNPGTTEINNPCFHQGYSYEYNLSGKSYTFQGTSTSDDCKTIAKEILNLKTNCGDEDYFCGINESKNPKISQEMKFYGINALTYTASFLGIDDINYHSAKNILEKAQIYCSKTWTQVKQENPTVEEDYLRVYCFSGIYYYNLLVNGFGFNENWESFIFSNVINKTEIGFALGAMVLEVDSLNL